MKAGVPGTDSPASPADPPDHSGSTVPEHIAFLLHAVDVLLGYGRHLLATVRHRAAAPNFTIIAACFGTSNLPTTPAHLNRGILRGMALERVLLARAATGRDIIILPPPRAHGRNTPRAGRRPTSRAAAHTQDRATPVATPRL